MKEENQKILLFFVSRETKNNFTVSFFSYLWYNKKAQNDSIK
jgi:hypothetical protein